MMGRKSDCLLGVQDLLRMELDLVEISSKLDFRGWHGFPPKALSQPGWMVPLIGPFHWNLKQLIEILFQKNDNSSKLLIIDKFVDQRKIIWIAFQVYHYYLLYHKNTTAVKRTRQ